MTTYEEKLNLLKKNRAMLLRLLEENNAVEFQDLLIEHPNYIHKRCSNKFGVSYGLTLLLFYFM